MTYDPAFEAHCGRLLERLVEADPETADLVRTLLRRPRRKPASRVVELMGPSIVGLGIAQEWELRWETWRRGPPTGKRRVAAQGRPPREDT